MEPRNRRWARVPTRFEHAEGNSVDAVRVRRRRPRRGRRPLHVQKHGGRTPGGPPSGLASYGQVRTGTPRGTPVMDGCRESDRPRVSTQLPHKGRGAPGRAEGVERRGLATGKLVEPHRGRTQRRETLSQAHDGVR
jgi:hypothetical protein